MSGPVLAERLTTAAGRRLGAAEGRWLQDARQRLRQRAGAPAPRPGEAVAEAIGGGDDA